jgi:hypothetical protein
MRVGNVSDGHIKVTLDRSVIQIGLQTAEQQNTQNDPFKHPPEQQAGNRL